MRYKDKEVRYWIPFPAIAAALLLLLLAVFVVSLAFIGDGYSREIQVALETQAGETTAATVAEQGNVAGSGGTLTAGQQDMDAKLKALQAELQAQKEALDKREQDMATREATLSELVSVKASIVKELTDKFDSLGLSVDIDKVTGSVRFNEAILFATDQSAISNTGKQAIDKFVPAYLEVLLSDKNKKFIDEIIIEGHADDGGSYQYNLELSQKRAYEVANYIILKKYLSQVGGTDAQNLLTIAGRSFSDPVMENGSINKDKSRRVEFVFKLANEELLSQMLDSGDGAQ